MKESLPLEEHLCEGNKKETRPKIFLPPTLFFNFIGDKLVAVVVVEPPARPLCLVLCHARTTRCMYYEFDALLL